MKSGTKRLLEQIDQAHDWLPGQVRGGGGTVYSSVDVCQCCGLQRESYSDRQNGIEGRWTFKDHHGNPIPLQDVAAVKCACEAE